MDMANHLNDFDIFVNQMKTKIIKCSGKHRNEKTTLNDLKNHFIDELIELFMIKDADEINDIKHYLLSHNLDKNELCDVANMCWILSFFIDSGSE